MFFTGLGRKVWRCMILKGLINIQLNHLVESTFAPRLRVCSVLKAAKQLSRLGCAAFGRNVSERLYRYFNTLSVFIGFASNTRNLIAQISHSYYHTSRDLAEW